MLKRVASVLLVSSWIVVGHTTAVYADEMSFGLDEVDPVVELEHLTEMIAEGKRLYEQKQYAEASLLFYNVLQDDEFGAEAYAPEAEYELAKTLFRMELYQGSMAYFGRIVDEGDFHPFYVAALRGLVLLTEAIPGDSLLTSRLAAYAHRFPDDVPESYRDRYAYLVGRYFYSMLELDSALELLNSVSKQSPLYPKARYLAGITHVSNYDAQSAVEAFRDILRYLRERDSVGLSAEENDLLELTNLGMARVFYSIGQFDTSLRYYSRIERTSPRWLDALFESSWAFFQVDHYNNALGNLHTLNSPFFADTYFPEGPILSAVIFFYNCRYARVRHVLEDFEYVFEPLKKEVETVVAENEDPMEMHAWFQKLRTGTSDLDPQLFRILDAALDDDQVRLRFDLVETIEAESKKMESMASSWTSSPLGDNLIQESALAHSFAIAEAGEIAQQRLQRVVRELEDLIMQQKRILFEVARAERGDIEADIRAGMLLDGQDQQRAQLNLSDENIYWTFDGEYWKDELGSYVFSIDSECRR